MFAHFLQNSDIVPHSVTFKIRWGVVSNCKSIIYNLILCAQTRALQHYNQFSKNIYYSSNRASPYAIAQEAFSLKQQQ
jgi:hypothetical protein